MSRKPDPPKTPVKSDAGSKSAREAKLAEALRANLRRRKQGGSTPTTKRG